MNRFETWSKALAQHMAAELTTRRDAFANTHLRALAADFHPWHAILELSILTDTDEADVDDQAAWEHFEFTHTTSSETWSAVQTLARQMQDYYKAEAKAGRGPVASDALLRCCAEAMMSPLVQAALELYHLTNDFTIILTHPDDPSGRNYCRSRA